MAGDIPEVPTPRAQSGGAAKPMLHVHNGDCAAEFLRLSGVPGDICVWAEALHEGPVPAGVSPEQWRRARARLRGGGARGGPDGAGARLRRWDAGLDSYPEYGEVVLWLEHDLFDQLILIRHL